MSKYQPTLREAAEQVAFVQRVIDHAQEVRPISWSPERLPDRFSAYRPVLADGFIYRNKSGRAWWDARWPISRIERRCDDCGCVLRARRDAGGHGFYYDKRWLSGDPSKRDPRLCAGYEGHWVCLSCFNRARPKLRQAEALNENRLLIGRIQREIRRAA